MRVQRMSAYKDEGSLFECARQLPKQKGGLLEALQPHM